MGIIADTDAAWAAGFLDGEGSLGVHYTERTGAFHVQVTASNRDVRPLTKLKELFGGSVHNARQNAYVYVVSNRLAEGLLRAVQPYAVVKGEQIELLLAFCSLVHHRGHNKPLTTDEFTERYKLKMSVQQLNARFNDKAGVKSDA